MLFRSYTEKTRENLYDPRKTELEKHAQPDIDGGLVGGASLKPDFGKIVNYNK